MGGLRSWNACRSPAPTTATSAAPAAGQLSSVHVAVAAACPPHAGVRSHQAKKVMQSMRVGDRAFFYHSNAKPPGIVGIVEVSGLPVGQSGMAAGPQATALLRCTS